MPFSTFLDGKRGYLRSLVRRLRSSFAYAGVLGTDVHSRRINVNLRSSSIGEDNLTECGFVVKLHDGGAFYEYSFDSFDLTPQELAEKITASVRLAPALAQNTISCPVPADGELKKSFVRESDFGEYSDGALLAFCRELCSDIAALDGHVANAFVSLAPYTVDKLFISKNRELDQHYGWCNGSVMAAYRDGKVVSVYDTVNSHLLKDVLAGLPAKKKELVEKARRLVRAKPVEPGMYDIITAPSISGLIAHEAFGHGVEMDQFVKDRALAKHYMNKYVASPVCNMRDGAASVLSAASYFFDDDGVLAHDTQIIRDGVLVSGISDLASASQLGTEPTGNGRRESFKRKAYTRMTNTFFEAGKDKLEDMIASVKHGYMLFDTNNGMEDPKNWQIQCTAEYGIEIIDGKLTENYVAPVVISGSVPELLKSVTMVSDSLEIEGAGGCGKGYKEWVRVSDGGPALKARGKLA